MKSISKKEMRKRIRERLASIDFSDLINKSSRLSENFFSWTQQNQNLFLSQMQKRYLVSYYPFENEPQLNIEIEGGGEAYGVAYARIQNWKFRQMEAAIARREQPGIWEEVALGDRIKIFQPDSSQPLCNPDQIAALLVPGLAFTKEGGRLGRGAGFYDRFLSHYPNALRIGIAFEEQIESTLPLEAHDLSVDILLTDNGIYRTNSYEEWKNQDRVNSKG